MPHAVKDLPGCCATFAVDDVVPCTDPLPLTAAATAYGALLGGPLLACSDPARRVVADVTVHPLAAAVHLAFSQHRPLILTPDALWLVVLQGVAQHVACDPERLRSRLVAHEGRKAVLVQIAAVPDPRTLPWPEIVDEFIAQLAGSTPLATTLPVRFSTTGSAEWVAQSIALMDIVAPFHEYILACICGIPRIGLAGTAADWQLLHERVLALPDLELDWWYDHLRPLTAQFARAAAGDVDRDHWQRIYKLREAYGGDVANGWLMRLFPYLRDAASDLPIHRNPLLGEADCAGISSSSLPNGGCRVPLTLVDTSGAKRPLVLAAGILGVAQCDGTLVPQVDWGIQDADPRSSALAAAIAPFRDGLRPPPPAAALAAGTNGYPTDFRVFASQHDGGELRCGARTLRLLPVAEVDGWANRDFAVADDGSTVELPSRDRPWLVQRFADGRRMVVDADSFTDLLRRLASGGVAPGGLLGIVSHRGPPYDPSALRERWRSVRNQLSRRSRSWQPGWSGAHPAPLNGTDLPHLLEWAASGQYRLGGAAIAGAALATVGEHLHDWQPGRRTWVPFLTVEGLGSFSCLPIPTAHAAGQEEPPPAELLLGRQTADGGVAVVATHALEFLIALAEGRGAPFATRDLGPWADLPADIGTWWLMRRREAQM